MASASVRPALAADSSAPRRKPVNRSIEAPAPSWSELLEVLPEMTSPVIGSVREGPSEELFP